MEYGTELVGSGADGSAGTGPPWAGGTRAA
jgi:hypothetical protein